MIKKNRPLSSINLNHYFLHPLKASLWGALRTFIVSFVIGCMVALHNIFYEPFTAKILAHPLLSFIAFGILGGLIQLQGVSNRHYAKQANYRQIKRYLDKAESAVEVFLNSALFELYELILFKQENLLTNEQFDNKKNEYIHNELLCSTYDFILLVELKNDLLISDASLEFKKYAFFFYF